MSTPAPEGRGTTADDHPEHGDETPGEYPDDSQPPLTSGDPGRGKVGVRRQPPGTKPNVPAPTPPDSAPD